MLEKGSTQELTEIVTKENTADAVGNKSVFVYATPFLVALMERTCIKLMEEDLDSGEVSVGTNINLDHLAPTPIGNKILCRAELLEQSGKKYVFDVKTFDNDKLIGKAIHTRYKVNLDKFLNNI